MTTPISPPAIGALNDALALIRLAQNPEQARQLTEDLNQATKAYTETLNALRGREDRLNAREKDLTRRESQLSATQSKIDSDRTALDAKSRQVDEATRKLEADQTAHARAVDDHVAEHWERIQTVKADEDRLTTARTALEQTTAAHHASLNEREEKVRLAEEDIQSRKRRIQEIVG